VVYRHAAKGMTVARLVDSWEEVDRTSRAVLLCGAADSASAWSCRRELLRKAFLNVDVELHFNAMLLRTHHKSSEAWAFRRHLLNTFAPSELVKLAATEVCLVEELAKKYDHHYYAWNHWSWFCQCYLGVSNGDVLPNLSVMTPSHYGLFHHRIMNVLSELRGLGLPISKSPEPHEGSVHANVDASVAWASGALPFPTRALATFESERRRSLRWMRLTRTAPCFPHDIITTCSKDPSCALSTTTCRCTRVCHQRCPMSPFHPSNASCLEVSRLFPWFETACAPAHPTPALTRGVCLPPCCRRSLTLKHLGCSD